MQVLIYVLHTVLFVVLCLDLILLGSKDLLSFNITKDSLVCPLTILFRAQ